MDNAKFDLLKKQNEREIAMINERLYVLDKVKELVLMKSTEYMTTQMVADYYNVGLEAIESLVSRHKEEVTENGFFNKRSILNIGMLLEDSPVAEEVRTLLLDNHAQLAHIHDKLKNGAIKK